MSLNMCSDCGHTWHPRGRDISLRCPACGSRSTTLGVLGCLFAVIAVPIFIAAMPFRLVAWAFSGASDPQSVGGALWVVAKILFVAFLGLIASCAGLVAVSRFVNG